MNIKTNILLNYYVSICQLVDLVIINEKIDKNIRQKKMISRQSDIELIKEIHDKHPSHGYRWINAYARFHYGIVWSDNHVHLCCKYEGIRSKGKHYQWKKPDYELIN